MSNSVFRPGRVFLKLVLNAGGTPYFIHVYPLDVGLSAPSAAQTGELMPSLWLTLGTGHQIWSLAFSWHVSLKTEGLGYEPYNIVHTISEGSWTEQSWVKEGAFASVEVMLLTCTWWALNKTQSLRSYSQGSLRILTRVRPILINNKYLSERLN